MSGNRTATRNAIARVGLPLVIPATMVLALSCICSGRDLNFGVVAPGVLMRSAQPRAADLARIQAEHGLKTIVNLRSPVRIKEDYDCQAEKAFAEEHGITFVNLPISTPPSPEHIKAFLKIMGDPANHPVLVHCAEGQIRASMMCAVYGMERLGWSNERALAEQIPFKLEQSTKHRNAVRHFILAYRGGSIPSAQVAAEP
ncbi:MAG: dual specificity protein phosphatase family protein [Planctomycetes bacterium]|nr:dual specificity protein phosphatase family protein [Planctomycetota bacterium]